MVFLCLRSSVMAGKVAYLDSRERLVVALQDLARRVEAGTIRALAFATTSDRDEIGSGWHCLPGSSLATINGAISYLHHRFQAEAFQDCHEPEPEDAS